MNDRRMSLCSALAALALAACATAPPRNVYLEDVHRAFDQASASAEVARYGQGELVRAREALARADQVWNDRRDDEETRHQAYMALQNTQLALAMSAKRAADARIETAGAERERLRADIRTREAQAAQLNASAAQAQAQSARAEAQSAQAQAQFAQTQAQSAQAAAAAEAERANRLQRELAELAAKPTDHGLVVMLQDVLFDVGRANLLPGAQNKLDQLAAALKNHPERRVLVEGYTDSTGSSATNLVLSRARAESVRNALIARGIGGDRIEARGHGEARPVATNATQAGRTQNRRVEVVFSDEHGRFASTP